MRERDAAQLRVASEGGTESKDDASLSAPAPASRKCQGVCGGGSLQLAAAEGQPYTRDCVCVCMCVRGTFHAAE